MKGMLEQEAKTEQLTIVFHFTDGEKFTQELPIDHADAAEDVLNWIADKKGSPIFKWLDPWHSKVQVVVRSQVTFIEIHGYLDPQGKESKWFHKLKDKFKTFMYFKALKQYNSLKTWIKK